MDVLSGVLAGGPGGGALAVPRLAGISVLSNQAGSALQILIFVHKMVFERIFGHRSMGPSSSSTLIDEAFRKVKRAIIACELAPGDKLKVAELSDRYGFSSSPIREALSRLAQDGIVEANENRGFRVSRLSIEDFQELTRVRCLLETEALADSIEKGSDTWEAEVLGAFHRLGFIEKKLGKMAVALNDDWAERHKAFHFALFSACNSPLLMHFIESLFDRAERYRRFSALHRSVIKNKSGEHRKLMDAALARDPDKARQLLQNHIQGTLVNVANALSSKNSKVAV